MSSAQVINTTMSSPASRVNYAQGSGQSTYESVEDVSTNLATRGRDQYAPDAQLDNFEGPPQRRRRGTFQDQVVRFSGVLLSRDVGTTIVQAQAVMTRQGAGLMTTMQAERNVATYEDNQAMFGEPEVTTHIGVMH